MREVLKRENTNKNWNGIERRELMRRLWFLQVASNN
jgi:hypothetical protein